MVLIVVFTSCEAESIVEDDYPTIQSTSQGSTSGDKGKRE